MRADTGGVSLFYSIPRRATISSVVANTGEIPPSADPRNRPGSDLDRALRFGNHVGNDAILDRPDRRLGAIVDSYLFQDALEMNLHRAFGNVELVGDFLNWTRR